MRISTFLAPRAERSRKRKDLYRRKGGGGRGGGGGGGGRSGGGGGSSGGGGRSVPLGGSGSSTGGRGSATAYGSGGGRPVTIPPGQPFAGRTQGGATRNDIYGSSTYGSGYPGLGATRGVSGLGFPFFFWPVVWGAGAGVGTAAYLHSNEYGDARNSSRPGGTLVDAPLRSATLNTTLHIIADNATTFSLIESLQQNCSTVLSSPSTLTASAFDPDANGSVRPEQVVQYYRASSIALALEGYNNTAALSDDANAPPVPLPGWVDSSMLDCVNQTIGEAAPLIDAAGRVWGAPPVGGLGTVGLVGVVLCVLNLIA